ncbi:hypothetical protein BS47DRAFT_1353849 [Hydnum rufescens UP504]|uniref:Uncharacterized protein n=1 Tax=Hydnum rufescens UP504 TaxID=1448309 RepID=A0A9P6AHR2_9AGAM|nr:hypothetical protein BS47DRAFT_1353849 [Hydnum rufescens UP504]
MQYIRSVINRDLVTIFKFFYGQATQIWVHRVKVDDKRTEQLVQEEYGTKSVLHQDNPVVREVIDTWIQETGVHVVLDAESDAIYAVIRCSPNRPCQEAGVTSLDFDEMKTVMDCVMKHSGGTGSVRVNIKSYRPDLSCS